jgi:hypothetical protein
LEAIDATSKYVSKPHKVLVLDDVPLDVLVDSVRPELTLLGLVPALLDWLNNPKERVLIWQRILPPTDRVTISPVLICPDDLDLWCTVVVAEVNPVGTLVWWRRLGLDRTEPKSEEMPEAVGTVVEWFSGLGPYCFGRREYERCLSAFKQPDAEQSCSEAYM